MFNWKFVLPPTMLMLLLAYGFFEFPRLGDFAFHSTYEGGSGYPSGVAFLVNLLPLPQELGIMVLGLLFSVVFPYILIYEITKDQNKAWVYLYGSNIATMLFSLYFVPQAIIQTFMLFSILIPQFFFFFLIFGGLFHNSWIYAVFISFGFYVWKRA